MHLHDEYEDTQYKWYRPDEVDEYITLLTPASLANCNTVQVPTELILTASIGFKTAGCILASAAR